MVWLNFWTYMYPWKVSFHRGWKLFSLSGLLGIRGDPIRDRWHSDKLFGLQGLRLQETAHINLGILNDIIKQNQFWEKRCCSKISPVNEIFRFKDDNLKKKKNVAEVFILFIQVYSRVRLFHMSMFGYLQSLISVQHFGLFILSEFFSFCFFCLNYILPHFQKCNLEQTLLPKEYFLKQFNMTMLEEYWR